MDKNIEQLKNDLIIHFGQLDEDTVYLDIDKLLDANVSEEDITSCMNLGMKKVGDLFEIGEYFIADLMFSGLLYCSVLDKIRPEQQTAAAANKGTILTGVVQKDIHDIGKDIVVSLLTADGFEVIDLGVDVSPEAFVDAIRTHHPIVVMLSGMMSFALDSMKKTIDAIEQAGLRDQIKLLIGGGCVMDGYVKQLHADYVSYEPADSLSFCNRIISGE